MIDYRRVSRELAHLRLLEFVARFHRIERQECRMFPRPPAEPFADLQRVVAGLPAERTGENQARRLPFDRITARWFPEVVVKGEPHRDACACRPAVGADPLRVDVPLRGFRA